MVTTVKDGFLDIVLMMQEICLHL